MEKKVAVAVTVSVMIMMVLAAGAGSAAAEAASCTAVYMGIAPCLTFLNTQSVDRPSPACCAAAGRLDQLAKVSLGDRKRICTCLTPTGKSAIPDHAAAMNRVCGLTTIAIGRKMDCAAA